jgi:hypothetical protein
MSFTSSVYERLEKQILLISDPRKYPVYLNRLIQSCRCITEKRFPVTVQDQTTIILFLNVSRKSHHAQQHLQPFLKQILDTVCKSIVSETATNHHDFVIKFFVNMVQMGSEVEVIAHFISSLSLTEGDNFHLQLYLNTSLVLVEHIRSLAMIQTDVTSQMVDISLNEIKINDIAEMSEQFIRYEIFYIHTYTYAHLLFTILLLF